MKHKFFTLLFAILASLGTMFAQSGTCGDNLTWNLTDSVLTISGTGAMDDYNNYGFIPWYSDRDYIRSVVINDGVTSIGESAFHECTNLSSIEIPNSVTYIGVGAFSYCTSLSSCEVPNSVTSIGSGAFHSCSSLVSVTLPDSLVRIESFIFDYCTSLTSIEIPDSVKSIGDYAFEWCTGLTSIEIPDGVISIGDRVFWDCKNLTSVTLPNSVTSVGYGAFYDTKLSAPLYNAHVFAYMPSSYSGAYTIPDGIESIAGGACSYCTKLTSIEIPNSVTEIGVSAFSGCSCLTSAIIGSSVTSIGWRAFEGWRSLTSLTNYATTPQDIQDNAIFGYTFPANCILYVPAESVAAYQAADVWKEFGTILAIGETPESCIIASGTCGAQGNNLTWSLSCDSVLTISGTGEMKDYGWNVGAPWGSRKDSIRLVVITDGVTSIGSLAFASCNNMISVEVPNSVTSIGVNAFYYSSSLSSIELPNSVTSIGESAFTHCTGLISIEIPNSITSIERFAFNYCTSLTSVTIPNSVTSIGYSAFFDCSSLDSVEIPNSVTSIGDNAFGNCSRLTSIEIPNSVTSIGYQAFYCCDGLISVTLPNSVTSIGNRAFYSCYSLTSITNYATTPQTITTSVFNSVNKTYCTLYVPAESVAAYQAADVWKDFKNIQPINSEPAAEHTYTVVGSSEVLFGSLWLVTDVNNDMILQKGDDTFLWKKENVTLAAGNIEFKVCEDHSWTQSWPEYNYVLAIAESGVYTIQIYFNPATGIVTADATKQESCVIASGTCGAQGDNLTWTLTCDSILTISGTGAMADYASKRAPWYTSSFITVIIEDGVTSIGDMAFYSCGVKIVEIGDSVTHIGYQAFKDCRRLSSINIPNSITYIGKDVFYNCISLPVINNLRYADSYLVEAVDKTISSIIFKNGTKWIENKAFYNCDNLTSVTIPDGVTSIGAYAFGNCSSLTYIEIPSSVTNIGYEPFTDCPQLTTIYINSDTLVGYYGASSYYDNFGSLFGSQVEHYIIGNSVTRIGEGVFSRSTNLKYVEIPNSVTSLGDGAFSGCSSLVSVEIPNSVTSLGEGAFSGCSSLVSVEIPNSVTSLGEGAFSGCSSLISVTIPNSVTSIGNSTFYYCNGLISVTLPNSVKSIGGSAFEGCSVLAAIVIPDSITSIGNRAFYNCSTLKKVTIGGSVSSIGSSAFSGCQSLDSITIPRSVTSIGSGAFQFCNRLNARISDLTAWCSINFGDNTANPLYFANNLYLNDSLITNLIIPSQVTSIGNYAFVGCSGLKSVEIPNSVTSIGYQAFYYCNGLISVTLPNSVTSIGNRAFYSCYNLTSITNYATTPQTINTSVFNSVNKTYCTLYVPAESVSAYQAADVWKEFGNILPIDGYEDVNYATLADIYNMAADSTFTLGAFDVMYVPDFQSGSNMYIKDSTGSCVIYKVNYGLQAGDHVEAGLQGKVSIYNGLHEVIPITAKEDLIITHGEAPAPIVATEAPSLNNASQYVVYEGVSFTTDTAFVEGRRHTVYGSWNGQTITFYNQYYIGATLSANKTYNITAVNTIYRTTPQAYPLAVEEVTTDSLEPCLIASGTCGDNLTWELSCDSVLTISGTGEMENSDYSDIPWNSYRNSIKSLIIENGVTSINNYAFQHCESLTYITIPNSVTKGLNYYACDEIISIDVESGNQNYSSIDGVLFDKSQTILMKYPSKNPRTEYSIPSSVTSVRNDAFHQSTNLISITIPNSVRNIGSYYPFSYCTSLISINVATDNPNYSSTDGVLFNKDKTSLIQYPGGKQGEYAIPNSVTSIGEGAFMGCAGLTSIEIPNSITSISSMVFDHCTSLSSVILPDGVTTIEYQAFYSCTNLTSVTIPSSVTSIENHVFSECSNLTLITNYAVEPQAVTQYMFMINWATNHLSNCTLYVPAQSIAAYQTADVWKEFGNILPIEEPIVEPTDSVYDVVYIDQAGLQLDAEPIILHLPVTPVIEGFSFLKWQVVAGDLENGIYIQAVYTANESTNAPEVYTNPANKAQKLIRNGNIYILTGEKVYTVTGQEVK